MKGCRSVRSLRFYERFLRLLYNFSANLSSSSANANLLGIPVKLSRALSNCPVYLLANYSSLINVITLRRSAIHSDDEGILSLFRVLSRPL